MRILMVNPNTTLSVTATLLGAAEAVASALRRGLFAV